MRRSSGHEAGPPVVLSVKPFGDVWLVREARASVGEVYYRKADAVARAGRLLRRRGGGWLRIFERGGAIEREIELRPGPEASRGVAGE